MPIHCSYCGGFNVKRVRQDSMSLETPGLLFGNAFTPEESDSQSAETTAPETSEPKGKKRKSVKKAVPKEIPQEESSVNLFGEKTDTPDVRVFGEQDVPTGDVVASATPSEAPDELPTTQEVDVQENKTTEPETATPPWEEKANESKPCQNNSPLESQESTAHGMPTPQPEETEETNVYTLEPSVETVRQRNKKPSAYQVVARRYRPQAFDELIGQETVARALSNAIETDRVGHAYLFTGARGVGKTSCARIFAKALNCVEGPTTHPCLKCDSCLGIATGDDVDVLEIDGASNRGVDEIRLLRQNATIAPSRSLYKIYIIDEVHMLTREAFNALLKTLEEPPARVKFIFCTTEPNKIPITILSRCQRFDFNSINGNSIATRLAQIASQEGAKVEDGVFEILARRANGSMRDAQSLLEQLLSFAPDYISQETVHSMLGSVDDRKIFDILESTAEGNASRVFETLAEAANQGVDFGVLIEQTLGVYRDLMVVASGCGAKELLYSPVARFSELQTIAQRFGIRRILASLQILDQTAQRMRYSAQARILAEIALVRLCRLDAFQSLESLIVQLQSGVVPNAQLVSSSVSSVEGDEQKKNLAASNDAPRAVSPHTLAASTPSVPSSLNVFSPKQLLDAWQEATNRGVVLPSHAATVAEIRLESSNTLVAVFPQDRSSERDYCEKERTTLQNRLSELLGASVVLRLILDPNLHSPETTSRSQNIVRNSPAPQPRANIRNLYEEVASSELYEQLREVFDAELAEVQPPEGKPSP